MKKILALITVFVVATNLLAQNIQAIAIGTMLPMADVPLKSTDGKEVTMKDMVQKNGVLVMFSCNTCPFVIRYQARALEAMQYAKKNGFGVIVINSNEAQRDEADSYTAMQQYAKTQKYTAPYALDKNSAVANAFGATRTPECFLFDANQRLVYHGAIDDNQDALQAKRTHLTIAIDETAAGKDVAIKETRSVGCTIKRME